MDALPRTLTVLGVSGEKLLDAAKVSSLSELQELTRARFGAHKCRFLTSEGKCLQDWEGVADGATLTAVALGLNPLLQMVGLEDKDGCPVDDKVPLEEMERIALEIAIDLANIGCFFGGPGHLCGHPPTFWRWDDILPAPPHFQKDGHAMKVMKVREATEVVHTGSEVVFTSKEGSLVPNTLVNFTVEKPVTVQDMIGFRGQHQAACRTKVSELLATRQGADTVDAEISLKEYTKERVCFELGYHVYNEETEGFV